MNEGEEQEVDNDESEEDQEGFQNYEGEKPTVLDLNTDQ